MFRFAVPSNSLNIRFLQILRHSVANNLFHRSRIFIVFLGNSVSKIVACHIFSQLSPLKNLSRFIEQSGFVGVAGGIMSDNQSFYIRFFGYFGCLPGGGVLGGSGAV